MTESLNAAPSAGDDWTAKYARQDRLEAEVWPVNKTAVMAALAAAGISQVLVTFDGYGDSGQIEGVDAKAGDNTVDLPSVFIAWLAVEWGANAPKPEHIALTTAVENIAYGCLARTHMGWENNEGAYGDITFDVADGTVTLDYNERIETSEYSQHVL